MLINSMGNLWACPDHIAVIGGGRWARVLLEVLCGLVPSSVKISAHSLHNAPAMLIWARELGLDNRIQVSDDYPKAQAGESCAVIVANAARDHEKVIEWALSECLPVLVEKPVTLTSAATQRMVEIAISKNVYLAAAHVFLFAKYVDAFSRLIAEAGSIESICVHWMDPRSESRYGEAKSYDPGLTIYADWLPHVLSILGYTVHKSIQLGHELEVFRGGAHLRMNLLLGKIPCEIELVRNGNSRQRLIEIRTRRGPMVLNFTNEPGIIISDGMEQCGDPNWGGEQRPVSKMLQAFLNGASTGEIDKRLDIQIGFRSNQLIDQLSPIYLRELSSWFGKRYLLLDQLNDADFRYFLSELIVAKDPNPSVSIEKRVEYVVQSIKKYITSSLVVEYKDYPLGLVEKILEQGKLTSYL